MKLQTKDWTTGKPIPFAELSDVLQIFLRNSKGGIALVPYTRGSISTQLLQSIKRRREREENIFPARVGKKRLSPADKIVIIK